MGIRTAQDFVEDLVSDGRSWKQIWMIAFSTRWKNLIEEVEQEYRVLRKRQKQISEQNGKDKK